MNPDAWLDVYSGKFTVRTEYVGVLNLLEIRQTV
jgi:hypothetical protein